MGRVEKTVFISYRRTNAPWALALFQHLTHHGFDVFYDFMGLASGDFERVILENIGARAHFLVLLTPSALDGCAHAGDWLRREIETALVTQRNVVPLMLEGFDFNTPGIADQLTGPIAVLKSYNALRVPVEYFEAAMERLRGTFLNVALDAVSHPVSAEAQQVTHEQQRAAIAAPAVQESELTAQEHFERGFEAPDGSDKLRFYSQAIDLNPNFAEAFYQRGVLRELQGDQAGALEDFDAAIRLKPHFGGALICRGSLRVKQGDVSGLWEDFHAVIHAKPGVIQGLAKEALLRKAEGDPEASREVFNAFLFVVLGMSPDVREKFIAPSGDLGAGKNGPADELIQAVRELWAARRVHPDLKDL